MELFSFKLLPDSPWLTPWQSDTLAGLLCWTAARTRGGDWLRREIIEPAFTAHPPFVVSDAFPSDWLPVPITLRLGDWTPEQRKPVRRSRWLRHESFRAWQRGEQISVDQLISRDGLFGYSQLRNCIGRATGTTGGAGGLFPKDEWVLDRDAKHLIVYARIDSSFRGTFYDLLSELSQSGFGADASAGKGQFRVGSALEPAGQLDDITEPNGCTVLSTFQPSDTDSTNGLWETFTKYGKLGPDFGLENVFKRPLVMLRPGACFRSPTPRGWIGRAIPTHELFDSETTNTLNGRGASVVQYAFGLALPCSFLRESSWSS
jgi:CRISPR/Cas system CSM-associated protein Csm4 (group 5 of RAMP superfamily)